MSPRWRPPEESDRILGPAPAPDLEMEVGTSSIPTLTRETYHLLSHHLISDLDAELREVGVEAQNLPPMIDDDEPPITTRPTCPDHPATTHCTDWSTYRHRYIYTMMQGGPYPPHPQSIGRGHRAWGRPPGYTTALEP